MNLFDEARAAEADGRAMEAMRLYQRLIKDDPDHIPGWMALARLHEENGDRARAEACHKRLTALGVTPEAELPEFEEIPEEDVSEADRVRFCHLFAGREGVHARMWHDPTRGSGYSPIDRPLTPELVQAHLHGSMTLGIYLVRRDDTATLFVLDLDIATATLRKAEGNAAAVRALTAQTAAEGRRILGALRDLGFDPLYVDSGYKGRHFWCFLRQPAEAAEIRAAGRRLLAHIGPLHPSFKLEFFPKQDKVREGGLGNLVKLPLGLHLRSGRRAVILDDNGQPHPDPWGRLRTIRRCDLGLFPDTTPAEPAPLDADDPAPPVVPAPEKPSWTEADYEGSPTVGPIVRGCPVIRTIIERALSDRRIRHPEIVVLNHSLGHLPDGVRAVNHLYARIPDLPDKQHMQTPHRGNPISCARIRQRVPHVVDDVPCDCRFALGPGDYPNPLLHREPEPDVAPASLSAALEAYARLLDRQRKLEEEAAELRQTILPMLARIPDRRWRVDGGEWAVTYQDGLPVLGWEPDP